MIQRQIKTVIWYVLIIFNLFKDTIAKERAIRRQTLSGGEAESREAAARIAAAEANASKELRARQLAEKKLVKLEEENRVLTEEIEDVKRQLASTQVIISIIYFKFLLKKSCVSCEMH